MCVAGSFTFVLFHQAKRLKLDVLPGMSSKAVSLSKLIAQFNACTGHRLLVLAFSWTSPFSCSHVILCIHQLTWQNLHSFPQPPKGNAGNVFGTKLRPFLPTYLQFITQYHHVIPRYRVWVTYNVLQYSQYNTIQHNTIITAVGDRKLEFLHSLPHQLDQYIFLIHFKKYSKNIGFLRYHTCLCEHMFECTN
jgi:hypothetical protein